MHYKARQNEIIDSEGRQIAVVLPSNCSKKLARQIAAYAAQQLNHYARDKARRAERYERQAAERA